jgi:hypothetical protein
MSERARKRWTWTLMLAVLAGMVVFDLAMTHSQRGLITLSGAQAAAENRPVVALATSRDLSPALPLDSSPLTYEQVKELVYLALDRDTSPGALGKTVKPEDWVAIKVNMVSAPLIVEGRKIGGFWDGREDGVPHWGSVSDLRVTKALIAYLLERVGPKRISIIEGSGEIARTGSPYFDSYPVEIARTGSPYFDSYPVDGWTITWEAFDNLSYAGIVEGFNAAQSKTAVDIVDLLDDEPVLTPVPGGGLQLLGGKTRKWGYEDFVPGYGTPRGSWYVPRTLLEVDKLIDQATLKTTAPGITVFMKNYVGTVGIRGYGDGPGKGSVIDGVAIMPGYMDMLRIRPPDYCLGAGFWSSDGWYGGTYDINHNVVIAGHNVVASEAVAARIMGFNPRDLQQLLLARDLGLGSFEETDYQVVGGDPSQLVHRFPGNRNWKPSGFQEFVMLGPFDQADIKVDLLGDEAHAVGVPGQELAGKTWWKYAHRPGYPEPYTDMSHLDLGTLTNKIVYAFTYIQSDREQDGYFKFGADGPALIWLNGEPALEMTSYSVYLAKTQKVHLNKGFNTVLVKVKGTIRGAGFGLSIVDNVEGGRMLTDIRPVLPAPPTTAVEDEGQSPLPVSVALDPGYPNPFNATIAIPFSLPGEAMVRIRVVNSAGQTVRVLWDQTASAGTHRVLWDGRDSAGRSAGSGLYLVEMETGAFRRTQKITLLK